MKGIQKSMWYRSTVRSSFVQDVAEHPENGLKRDCSASVSGQIDGSFSRDVVAWPEFDLRFSRAALS